MKFTMQFRGREVRDEGGGHTGWSLPTHPLTIRSPFAAGLQIANTASKVDLFLNNVPYSGSQDSAGMRVIGVSTSFSGTVATDDTGNSANEETDSFGTTLRHEPVLCRYLSSLV